MRDPPTHKGQVAVTVPDPKIVAFTDMPGVLCTVSLG